MEAELVVSQKQCLRNKTFQKRVRSLHEALWDIRSHFSTTVRQKLNELPRGSGLYTLKDWEWFLSLKHDAQINGWLD